MVGVKIVSEIFKMSAPTTTLSLNTRRVYPSKKRKNWTTLHRKSVRVCARESERERAKRERKSAERERREIDRERRESAERKRERRERKRERRERENHTHSTQKHSYLSRGGSAPLETPRPHHHLRRASSSWLLRRFLGFRV